MEIPLDVRPERRRQLYAAVHPLPFGAGPARHGHGAGRGPRGAGKPYLYVPAAGKARPQVGRVRRVQPDRQHCHHGVLHGRHRLDFVLFCQIPDWGQRRFRLCADARRPESQRDLSVCGGRGGVRTAQLQLARRVGTRDQVHDDSAAGADAGAGHPQPNLCRSRRGAAVLPCAGFFQNRRQRHRGGHEPGVFFAVRRHGRHGNLRQLHRQGALPHGRVAAHHRAGHLCGGAGGHHHLPGLLHLRAGSHCRAKPAV